MSISDALRPDGTEFDPFLYAVVGEDRNGASLTVLSALARLDLEPWTEARELARLTRETAQFRLTKHLEAINGTPVLVFASESRAAKLIALLPKSTQPLAINPLEASTKLGALGGINRSQLALVGVVVLAVTIYLAQMG